MAQLTFTGRSGDGKRLLLVDDEGREHFVVVDARLRRALSGVPESNGQLEIPMESSLRPRDIQTRIRAGETPESVAHAAGTSVEKIMPFAAPVLAERAHVADRAQLASVRRRSSESGARTLGEAVAAQLRSQNADPAAIEWDAWRREDGRWTVTGMYDVAGRAGIATFSHDPRGNFVTVDDEDARWLVGDAAPVADSSSPAADDLAAARQRRLNAVPGEELPLGDDALEMVSAEQPPAAPASGPHDDHPDDSANEATAELSALGSEQSIEAYLEGTDAPAEQSTADEATEPGGSDPASDPASEPAARTEAEPRSRPARKRGRASVPSWDEIMFGGGKND